MPPRTNPRPCRPLLQMPRLGPGHSEDPHGKDALRRQIQSSDQQIDLLVYELYGLTDRDIRIVEGSIDSLTPFPPAMVARYLSLL